MYFCDDIGVEQSCAPRHSRALWWLPTFGGDTDKGSSQWRLCMIKIKIKIKKEVIYCWLAYIAVEKTLLQTICQDFWAVKCASNYEICQKPQIPTNCDIYKRRKTNRFCQLGRKILNFWKQAETICRVNTSPRVLPFTQIFSNFHAISQMFVIFFL